MSAAPDDLDLVAMVIDQDRCLGSGTCEMLHEDVFLLNDDTNIAHVVGNGSLPREHASSVVDRCPASAITFIEHTATGSPAKEP